MRTVLALATVYLTWSSTFYSIRLALDGLPPFLICTIRYSLAGVLMLLTAAIARAPRPSAREIRGAGLLGMAIVLVPNGAVVWAEQTITTGITALLGAVTPLIVLLLESTLPGAERPTVQGTLGVALGLVGVSFLVAPQLTNGFGAAGLAQVIQLLGCMVCAVAMVLGRRLSTPRSGLYNAATTMLLGGAGFGVVSLVAGEWPRFHPTAAPAYVWGGMAYLVIAGSCMGFTAFTWLVMNARPALIATTAYVPPLLALMLGAWLLHEPLAPATLLGAGLIVGSVVLVATGGRKQRSQS
jgi:drug/metabolite transporter (DMT)-like permease